MTAALDDVPGKQKKEPSAAEQAAGELAWRSPGAGPVADGPGASLKQLTKTVLEATLKEELTEHLGHEKHGRPDPQTGNIRNGTRPKTVLTKSGGEVRCAGPAISFRLAGAVLLWEAAGF
jgi:putative transposase